MYDDDDNRGAEMLGRVMGTLLIILATLVVVLLIGRIARAQEFPLYDCESPNSTHRYFANRTNFRFCVPEADRFRPGYDIVEWEWIRLDSTTPMWTALGRGSWELEVVAPPFARFQTRYRLCGVGVACLTSQPSITVATGPDVDVDNSGVVSVWDFNQACKEFTQRVVNWRLSGDEYLR